MITPPSLSTSDAFLMRRICGFWLLIDSTVWSPRSNLAIYISNSNISQWRQTVSKKD